jgi:NAD(P)-dependent dehydrogenase (short-subunit alcohol dehydrogenase family)
MPSATLEPGQSCFNLPVEGMEPVIGLNLEGTLLPTQVFGETMARAGRGCIVNVSSMAAQRAMTRVLGYGAAKARSRTPPAGSRRSSRARWVKGCG